MAASKQSDIITRERTAQNNGILSGLASFIAGTGIGAGIGALWHNAEKQREISRAREITETAKVVKRMRTFIPDGNEAWTQVGPSQRTVRNAESILAENKGFGGWWQGHTRGTKAIYGALVGMMIIGPIIEYVLNRRSIKKDEEAQAAIGAQALTLNSPGETGGKSFTAALDSERTGEQAKGRS